MAKQIAINVKRHGKLKISFQKKGLAVHARILEQGDELRGLNAEIAEANIDDRQYVIKSFHFPQLRKDRIYVFHRGMTKVYTMFIQGSRTDLDDKLMTVVCGSEEETNEFIEVMNKLIKMINKGANNDEHTKENAD